MELLYISLISELSKPEDIISLQVLKQDLLEFCIKYWCKVTCQVKKYYYMNDVNSEIQVFKQPSREGPSLRAAAGLTRPLSPPAQAHSLWGSRSLPSLFNRTYIGNTGCPKLPQNCNHSTQTTKAMRSNVPLISQRQLTISCHFINKTCLLCTVNVPKVGYMED